MPIPNCILVGYVKLLFHLFSQSLQGESGFLNRTNHKQETKHIFFDKLYRDRNINTAGQELNKSDIRRSKSWRNHEQHLELGFWNTTKQNITYFSLM